MIKKLLFFFVLASWTSSGFAQIQWGVKSALQYSNITAVGRDGDKAQTAAVPGISLGLHAVVPISDRLAINPVLVYVRRGFKQNGPSSIGRGHDFKARSSYLELPVDFLYRPEIGSGRLLVAVGPYLGYGTGGRWSAAGPVNIGDIRIDNKGPVAFQNDRSIGDMRTYVYAKPWDYGLHFKIGYVLFNHYSISFEAQRGIADLQPRFGDYTPEGSIRNKSLGVALGYVF